MTEPEPHEPRRAPIQKTPRKPSLGDRIRAHCAACPPARFTVDAMVTMAYAIEQIAPDRDPLELSLFVDWATGRLLGRLGQQPGMPTESELFPLGLQGIEDLSRARYGRGFSALSPARRRVVLESIEEGSASGGIWCEVPPRYFYRRFYTKVLHGMFAERKEWVQIGILRTADPGEESKNARGTDGRTQSSGAKRRQL